MNRQENLIIYMLFMGSLMLQRIVSQHCKGDIYSDYQMMLKGHTYKTIKVRRGSLDCRQACLADTRCRSYNVLFIQQICELTNSTKEASPDDFVQNNERYHMAKSGKNPWLSVVNGTRRMKQLRDLYGKFSVRGECTFCRIA